MLKIPNILNFICAYERFKSYDSFEDTSNMDERKRLVPNVEIGDFATGTYDFWLEEDFKLLCIYDNLIKLDIKSYYGRIYTHHIKFENSGDENYLTNLNLGNATTPRSSFSIAATDGQFCFSLACVGMHPIRRQAAGTNKCLNSIIIYILRLLFAAKLLIIIVTYLAILFKSTKYHPNC